MSTISNNNNNNANVNMSSIEEIFKIKQELLNHKRNQKIAKKEMFMLLDSINKNIQFMSDRLDQFALRTNIQLNDSAKSSSSNGAKGKPNSLNRSSGSSKSNNNSSSYDDVFNSVINTCNDFLSGTAANGTWSNRGGMASSNPSNNYSKNVKSIFPSSKASAQNSHFNNSSRLTHKTNAKSSLASRISEDSNPYEMSFGNSSDDEERDEDEMETIQAKKKARTGNDLSPKTPKELEESNNQQRLFNKYVRESVEKRLGKEFLLLHEIQEISQELMEEIKNDALKVYPPKIIRPRRAWHLAKASLRCRRRSLRRQKEKTSSSSSMICSIDKAVNDHEHEHDEETSNANTMNTESEDVLLSTHIPMPQQPTGATTATTQ